MPNVNDYNWTDPATGLPTAPGIGKPTLKPKQVEATFPDPTTAPTPAPILPNPATPASPTAGDIYGNINFETPEERAFRESQGAQNRTDATSVIDENAIRSNTLAQFQAEIDALNRVYAEKKQAEQLRGEGRLGGVAAVGARRGLLGSDFGVAQRDNQETANVAAVDAIEDERMLKYQNILSTARKMATDEVEKRTEAKRLGAENYLQFISDSASRRESNTKKIAAQLYADGNYDEANLKEIADSLGVSVESLKTTYKNYAAEQDAIKAQEEAAAKVKEEEAAKKLEDESLKRQQELLKEGYNYVATPAKRDQLRDEGYDITEIAGRTYAKKPKLTTKTVTIGKTKYSLTTNEAGDIVKKTVIGGSGGGVPPSTTKILWNDLNASERGNARQVVIGQGGTVEDIKKLEEDNDFLLWVLAQNEE